MAITASAIRAGRSYIELFLHDEGFQRNLNTAQAKLHTFGRSAQAIGGQLLALGTATAAPFAASIKAASDMEESLNKFNVVFGESSAQVRQWSDEFASSIGRSKLQIVDFMASSQDLFVPLGFAADEAQRLSQQVTKLSIDLASFNNKNDADVLRDLHAALTGSGEVMKKYGVIVSEAAVKQELLNMGMDAKTADNQAKVQARLNIIMRGTTAAQGDAERSAGSFANQMKALQAEASNAAVSIGQALLPAVTPLVTEAAAAAKVFAEWAEANPEMVSQLATLAVQIGIAGAALIVIGKTAQATAVGIGLLNKTLAATGRFAATFKTLGIAAILATIAIHAAKASKAFKDLNNEIDKANGLDSELAEKGRERTQKLVSKAEALAGDEKAAFVDAELEKLSKNIETLTKSEAGIKSRIDNANTVKKGYDFFGLNADMDADRSMLQGVSTRLSVLKERRKRLQGIQNAEDPTAQETPTAKAAAKNEESTNPLADWIRGADKAVKESPTKRLLEKIGKVGVLGEMPAIFGKAFRDAATAKAAGIDPGSPLASAATAAASGVVRSGQLSRNAALDARSSAGLSAVIAATAGNSPQDKLLSEMEEQTDSLDQLVAMGRANQQKQPVELKVENV